MSDNVTGAPAEPAATLTPGQVGPASTWKLYATGWVLPGFSVAFYHHATRRRVIGAVGFFLLFAWVIAILQTVSLSAGMAPVRTEVEQAFRTGQIPTVVLSHGEATVRGRQPFVLFRENRQLVVLDATGRYTAADLVSGNYDTALLLTKTELVVLNRGRLQTVRLQELQSFLGDPFEFNAATLERWLSAFTAISLVALVLWNCVARLAYVALLALVLWGVAALGRREAGYASIFITGLYAVVPATYLQFALERSHVQFCLMGTGVFIAIWGAALIALTVQRNRGLLRDDAPLNGWRALIGVPLLFVLVLNVIFTRPIGALLIWIVAALTALAFYAVAAWTGPRPDPGQGTEHGSG